LDCNLEDKTFFRILSNIYLHQITDQCVALKSNIIIHIKICTQSAPTCKGVTVTPSSGSALFCDY